MSGVSFQIRKSYYDPDNYVILTRHNGGGRTPDPPHHSNRITADQAIKMRSFFKQPPSPNVSLCPPDYVWTWLFLWPPNWSTICCCFRPYLSHYMITFTHLENKHIVLIKKWSVREGEENMHCLKYFSFFPETQICDSESLNHRIFIYCIINKQWQISTEL